MISKNMNNSQWESEDYELRPISIPYVISIVFIFSMLIGCIHYIAPPVSTIKDDIKLIEENNYIVNNDIHGFNRDHEYYDETMWYNYFKSKGFDIKLSTSEYRRLSIVYHYNNFINTMSINTGLSKPVIFSYFIIEATSVGIETDLFYYYYNPGGIKHISGDYVLYYDDCGLRKCKFQRLYSMEDAITTWSKVFNHKRYKDCKNSVGPIETCKCLYRGGYHSSKNIAIRVDIANEYYNYVSMLN